MPSVTTVRSTDDPLDPQRPYRDPSCREYLTAGSFAVVDQRIDPGGLYRLLVAHEPLTPALVAANVVVLDR